MPLLTTWSLRVLKQSSQDADQKAPPPSSQGHLPTEGSVVAWSTQQLALAINQVSFFWCPCNTRLLRNTLGKKYKLFGLNGHIIRAQTPKKQKKCATQQPRIRALVFGV